MNNQEHKKTLAYIIDSDFKIIFSNNEMKNTLPELRQDQRCYEIFGDSSGPCQECPLNGAHTGKSIFFDHLRHEWSSVTSAPIEIPCLGTCHVIINDSIEDGSEYFLYNSAGKPDYAELLELDYLNDSFKIAYHGEWTSANSPSAGRISTEIRRIAESSIHPEDRSKFYEFWQLHRLGMEGLPMPLLTTRHGEFRKVRPEGGYDWVQEILLPIHQSSENRIFVNNFFNTIGKPSPRPGVTKESGNFALHSRDDFFRRAESVLTKAPGDGTWCMMAIDIERLKLFNEWYGRQAGDELLYRISECLLEFQNDRNRIAGHFYDDDFAFLMPYDEDMIRQLCTTIGIQMKHSSVKMNILPAFGIYLVTDRREPVFSMYDRAKLACAAVKGNYVERIKYFDNDMLERLQSEYLLLSDVQQAFQDKEFTFYLQPKCNIENGKIVGAEALARWRNPEKGMVSPGIFVPFLEKSGLVSELDTYIWEEVCRWQRSMLDRGLQTVPISVNVSRIDIYTVDVAEYFQSLIKKYDLPPALIEIEITESAYAEDSDAISQVVKNLHNVGFRVSMDDFGSAYSSLNMLKDIDVDVLKIDMRFLDLDGPNATRGANILETICHMAHILGLKLVAEGVETLPQKDLLLKAGCNIAQGFHFYRPLPISEFEEAAASLDALDCGNPAVQQDELFYLKDLMLQNVFSLNMLDSVIGAMAFYEIEGEKLSLIRFNEQYAKLFGNSPTAGDICLNFGDQLYEEEKENVIRMINEARENITTGSELDLRRRRADGTDVWVHVKAFYLYQRNGKDIFYATIRDVTKVHKSNEVLRFLNNDMPGGYYRHLNDEDCTFTHISQRFLDIFGYTRAEMKELFDDKLINMVHPKDRQAVRHSVSAMEQTGGNYTLPCRMRSKSGYIFVLDQSRLVNYHGTVILQGIILHDFDQYVWLGDGINVEEDSAITSVMPCGFFQSEVDGQHQFSYISNSMLQMLGYSRNEFLEKFQNTTEELIYIKDRHRVDQDILGQIQHSNFVSCEYRVELADGSLKWVYSRGRITTDKKGKRWFNCCISDYDYLKNKYQTEEWQYRKYQSLSEIPGLIVYDYDPATDRLTLEMTLKTGKKKTVVTENYLRDIEQHGLVSRDCIAEQKALLQQICQVPSTGVAEFRGRITKNIPYHWYRFHYNSLADESGRVYRVVGRGDDIEEEIQTINNLVHRATKDSLTNLLNYEAAKDLSRDFLKRHKGGTLVLLDIDDFKRINDTLGHLAGDRILKTLAASLQNAFRKRGVVCRFGGDEFMIFVPGLTDRRKAERMAQKLLIATGKIQVTENQRLTCSVGITQVEGDIKTPFDTLFRQADTALYQSKGNGKNRCTFYAEEMAELIFLH